MRTSNKFLVLASIFVFSCFSCSNKNLKLNSTIEHELKFGGVYITTTIDDFNEMGFKYGDSVNVKFSNGYELLDIPYYNGYYVNNLDPLLVGYPGYPYIKTCFNNGPDMWEIGNLSENDNVEIVLNKEAKYLDIQTALDIHYTDIQGDMSDEVFANLRAANNIKKLKKDILYRSASPIDNQHNRAAVTDRLITDKVKAVANLSDNTTELLKHHNKDDFNSPYYWSLFENNNVIPLAMGMNFHLSNNEKVDEETPALFLDYLNVTFQDKLVKGLRFLSQREAPYLVHCVEGKDRTGFFCMIMEGLVGATYQEIIDDYMITYDNYYGITKITLPEKYEIIKKKNIDEMLHVVIGNDDIDITTADYEYYVEKYLLEKGMEQESIDLLKSKLAA